MDSKKKYPFTQLSSTSALISSIKGVQSENSNRDYFEISVNDPATFSLFDTDETSNFFFTATSFMTNGTVHYKVQIKPANSNNLESNEFTLDQKQTFDAFKKWLLLLIQYDETIDHSNIFFKNHLKEWVDYFELVDEDAENALTTDQILAIDLCFNQWILVLEEELENNEDIIIIEAKKLQSDLAKVTKRTFVKRMSTLFVKILQKNPSLLRKLLLFVGKEALKEGIQQGTGFLIKLITN